MGLSPKVTGGAFEAFSPLIAVGDLPPLYEEGGFSVAALSASAAKPLDFLIFPFRKIYPCNRRAFFV